MMKALDRVGNAVLNSSVQSWASKRGIYIVIRERKQSAFGREAFDSRSSVCQVAEVTKSRFLTLSLLFQEIESLSLRRCPEGFPGPQASALGLGFYE
jgi:hypothetical protein